MNILLYTWWDGDTPFYVGIGNPGREVQWRKRNPHCYAKRKSAESKGTFNVRIELTGLSWEEAWDLEKKRIAEIGMISQGTGPLTNYAEGGNGGNTRLGWTEERWEEFRILHKQAVTDSNGPSKGGKVGGAVVGRRRYITNGTENKRLAAGEPLPEGYWYGLTRSSLQQSEANKKTTGCRYITNGLENKRILPTEEIPEGWRLGMTKSHYRGKIL
jgi:hypothetical protein